MSIWNRTSAYVILSSLFLISCTQEKETIVIKEALPPAKIEASATVNKNLVTFEKASLGKLFMLIPTVIDNSRSAAPNLHKPQLITFEKNGDRVAVFNQTIQNNVDSVTADQLLQTFAVVQETSDKIVFDMAQGFLSMNYEAGLEILIPQIYTDIEFNNQNRKESHLVLKDAYISTLSVAGNAIRMKQVIRVVEDFVNPMVEITKEEKEKLEKMAIRRPEKVESSKTVFFEIKPYVPNKNFKSKTYDAENRFGFFVNNTFGGVGESDMKAVITRWSVDPKDGDIRVLVDKNVPEKMKTAVADGVHYWNRALGRDVLKVTFNHDIKEPQQDRTIVINWIKWDDSFSAYANVQTDPLTGEAIRGYVYMTSSFTKKEVSDDWQKNSGFAAGNLCGLIVDRPLIEQEDYVREVIAHEMGHIMGLRHNFAGSFNAEATDEEIHAAVERAAKGDNSKPVPVSSSVMDYMTAEPTMVSGGAIKNALLSYDKKAIEWGYANIDSPRTEHSYCSDEHWLEAHSEGREIVGCNRFDLYGNIFFAPRKEFLEAAKAQLLSSVEVFLAYKGTGFPLKYKEQVQLTWNPEFSFIEILYKNKEEKIPVTIDFIIDNYLSSYMLWRRDGPSFTEYSPELTDNLYLSQLNELGGLSGYLNSLKPDFTKLTMEIVSSEQLENLTGFEKALVVENLLEAAANLENEAQEKIEKLIKRDELRSSFK
ncbi:zinc-dependent metalloprotease [Bdellovibrio reynosensis]|uniref:Zinc-dependent metalloprotease n=1 Tax=Bdellovibrio reynosensis TaxID=2835041 RepID=A0ABY4CBR9_9BACT|nr:zinc-dependent metalloprotease [Bdellovibrio reynosensis]UOF02422.1 zinc-dependent metalloprotease [Bdellovibrio reynosensis]